MPGITPLIPADSRMTCEYQPSEGCITGMVIRQGPRAVIDREHSNSPQAGS